MKKITSQKFSKRIAQYGALSVAIGGFAEVNGQNIIYTDVDPDEGGTGVFYLLDLDNDGENDFFITQDGFGPSSSIPGVRMAPINSYYGAKTNAVLANNVYYSSNFSFVYPLVLNTNDAISSVNSSWNSNYQYMDLAIGPCYLNSAWCGETDKFVGLRFNVLNSPSPLDDETFYGWARLDVTDSSNWLIKDYAYNSVAGASILAGEGILGVDDNQLNNIKVIALSKSIGLYNLPQETSYKLFNMTGQEVLKGATNERDHVIEANALSSGVYIVELEGTDTNAVLRKKLVLQ